MARKKKASSRRKSKKAIRKAAVEAPEVDQASEVEELAEIPRRHLTLDQPSVSTCPDTGETLVTWPEIALGSADH